MNLNLKVLLMPVITFIILITTNTHAQHQLEVNGYTEPVKIVNQNPWPLLQNTITKLNQINHSTPFEAKKILDEDVLPLFDFDHIAYHITRVIPYAFTQKQNNIISNLIQNDLSNILLGQLIGRQIYGFKITNIKLVAPNYLEVRMRVGINSFIPVYLNLIIYNNSGLWKIVDVALNNNSLIQYYQLMIASKVNRYGVGILFNQ